MLHSTVELPNKKTCHLQHGLPGNAFSEDNIVVSLPWCRPRSKAVGSLLAATMTLEHDVSALYDPQSFWKPT